MLKNYLKIAIRNLARQKLYAVINVFGLALGIACCILIMLFVQREWSYDAYYKNADHLYRVLINTEIAAGAPFVSGTQPMQLATTLPAEFPEIEHAGYFRRGDLAVTYGDKVFEEGGSFANNDLLSMFDVEFVRGDRATALNQPNDLVLSEEMAKKYFGEENPLGKIMHVETRMGADDYVVVGVIKAMPRNSSFQFDFLLNLAKYVADQRGRGNWVTAFLQLRPEASTKTLLQKMPDYVAKYAGDFAQFYEDLKTWPGASSFRKKAATFQVELEPVRDIHLDTRVQISTLFQGDPAASFILAGIAMLILLIACINFMTLAIGRSANRAKEVGMRKVLGAVRLQLMRQFWGEAFLLCGIALLLGIVLAELLLPAFNRLTDRDLSINYFSDHGFLVGAAGLLLLVGLMAGSYPALLLSRFEPVEILKGKIKMGGKSFLMKALVVFQFGLSIFLIAATLGMARQLNLVLTTKLGFNPAQAVVVRTNAGRRDLARAKELVERFRDRALGNPSVINVSGTNVAFSFGNDARTFQYQGEMKNTFIIRGDEDYLATLGIELKEGRNFIKGNVADRQKGIIVNEAFLRHFGWSEPAVGKRLTDVDDPTFEGLEVIGVTKDFHFHSLHEEIRPMLIFENENWRLDCMLVRIAPTNIPATMAYLQNVWKEVAPGKPFDSFFLDEVFQQQYAEDMNWHTIVEYSSFFAVSLACLGLFGLATLSVANRTKEIGIRKVLGASLHGIIELISKDFMKLVIVANLIAWPIAYFVLRHWLNNYATRIQLGLDMFLLAGGLALTMAAITISVQVVKAALANPVESLRYE